MSIFQPVPLSGREVTKVFTFSTNRSAATYDLCTASGAVVITRVVPHVDVAAGGLTSLSFQTNSTTAQEYMSAVEGALAALTADKTVVNANRIVSSYLESGDKITGTIVGTGNAGSLTVSVSYIPTTEAATLT